MLDVQNVLVYFYNAREWAWWIIFNRFVETINRYIKISENTFLNEMQRTDYYYLNWNVLDVITEIEIISEI